MSQENSAELPTPDAIELLTRDHDRVIQLFAAFSRMDEEEDEHVNKAALVKLTCSEIAIHSRIEEELFYPAMREWLDTQELLDEAQVEHDQAKQLIAELEVMNPDDDLYDAKFAVLGEYIRHHIEEEQSKIFPKARKATIDLENLAIEIMHRKEELQEEYGLPPNENEEDDLIYSRARGGTPSPHSSP